ETVRRVSSGPSQPRYVEGKDVVIDDRAARARSNLPMKSRPPVAGRSGWRAGFGCGNVTGMAFTPPEKERRYRERQSAQAQSRLDMIETGLLQQAARCETLSSEDRAALANQIADLAMRYQWRATELSKLAQKVQPPGWNPPGAPGR